MWVWSQCVPHVYSYMYIVRTHFIVFEGRVSQQIYMYFMVVSILLFKITTGM